MEAFDVTPTGMTQISYIPRVKDVSSLKPLGASRPRGALNGSFKLDTSFTLVI